MEADLFVVFQNLMVELRDSFLRELDKEATGLQGYIDFYNKVLYFEDEELHEIIQDSELPH
jgi:hypothetical protein